jgi:hypothetical protein
MKNKHTYKEVQDANYIMEMMKEDVFGHRVISWSPADTARLRGKLKQPISDKEREVYVAVVEPLMKKKTYTPTQKDAFLDSFLDLDTRVSQGDYESTKDDEAEKMDKLLGVDLT